MFNRLHALPVVTIALLCFVAPASAAIATTASVYLKGEPFSWVSGAVGAPEVTWVHGVDGLFFSSTNFDQGVTINYDDGNFWSFDFAAPSYDPVANTNDGQQLVAKFYDNATRFPFNSPTRSGMDISGNGRGNNQLSGWFNVLEAVYGTDGVVERFAVDFRQYDENLDQTGPSLYGSLRFNSDIPLTPVPEPAAYVLIMLGLGLVFVAARGRRPFHFGV